MNIQQGANTLFLFQPRSLHLVSLLAESTGKAKLWFSELQLQNPWCSKSSRLSLLRSNSKSSVARCLPTPHKQSKVIFSFKKEGELRGNNLVTDTVRPFRYSASLTLFYKNLNSDITTKTSLFPPQNATFLPIKQDGVAFSSNSDL